MLILFITFLYTKNMEEINAHQTQSEPVIKAETVSQPEKKPAPKQESPWDIEALLKASFSRLKNRILSYYIAMLVFYGISFIGGALFVVYIIIIAGAIAAFHDPTITLVATIISIIIGIAAFLLFIYLASLSQLLLAKVIIQEPKKGIMETAKEILPMVWGYLWLGVASSIFFIGLVPLGLLSLFIIFLIWQIWGTFVTYVYLEQKKTGLDNLWVSKAMVSQKFLGVAGRILLVNGAYMMIYVLLLIYGDNLGSLLGFALSLFFTPYLICYTYEMYKQLAVPTEVVRPKKWIIVSIIGYIVIISLILLAGNALMEGFQKGMDSIAPPLYNDVDLQAPNQNIPWDSIKNGPIESPLKTPGSNPDIDTSI